MDFKELHEASNMNQTQFAKYFEIPYRTVQSWYRYGEFPDGRKCPPYLIKLMLYKLKNEGIIK